MIVWEIQRLVDGLYPPPPPDHCLASVDSDMTARWFEQLAGIPSHRLIALGNLGLIAERQGDGLVVRFANTPLFRGFWRGTERLFVNALYFGQVIRDTELPEIAMPPKPEVPRDK